ncbi:anaphase-promoting complex subunit cdc27 [Tulasnella sp. 419]|nr:anaphase-promoting complex subunit cdc27 [Tulasnella sp. 419]
MSTATTPHAPHDLPLKFNPIAQKYRSLIWSSLDCSLYKTALFYAERYFYSEQHLYIHSTDSTYPPNQLQQFHDARHLLAECLLRNNQVHSAIQLIGGKSAVGAGGFGNNPWGTDDCVACVEVFSRCCVKLGRFRQGHEALSKVMELKRKGKGIRMPNVTQEPRAYPDEAVLFCQAGSMALKANNEAEAKEQFLKALSINPFLWEALEGLCYMGQCPDIDLTIPPSSVPHYLLSRFSSKTDSQANDSVSTSSVPFRLFPGQPKSDASTPTLGHPPRQPPSPSKSSMTQLFGFGVKTAQSLLPSTSVFYQAGSNAPLNIPPQPYKIDPLNFAGRDSIGTTDSSYYGEPSFRGHGAASGSGPSLAAMLGASNSSISTVGDDRPSSKRTRSQMTGENGTSPVKTLHKKPSRGPVEALAAFRRSTRLLGGSNKPAKTTNGRRRPNTKAAPKGGDTDDMDEDMADGGGGVTDSSTSSQVPSPGPSGGGNLQPQQPVYDESTIAAAVILEVTRSFAKIVRALSIFDSRRALAALDDLPDDQKDAPCVFALAGRASFEISDYIQSSRAFDRARDLDPYRTTDMDIYSTVLWHLQEEVKLSFLAQELVSIDDLSPNAWIATGNCFSLQKDHGQALSCFKRATQLDPRCAYGYALSGHEALALEDHDGAVQFFRTAIKTDPRHYPAWYGLGMVYLRMNKLRKAHYHFRRAIEISPSNAVLVSCEGTVLEKLGRHEEALERFNRSLALSEKSPLVKFKRVKVLIEMKFYEQALKDLEDLRDLAPDEANVPFLLGKLYRVMGRKTDATESFTVARDLDPKLGGVIGHLLEEMGDEEEMDGATGS